MRAPDTRPTVKLLDKDGKILGIMVPRSCLDQEKNPTRRRFVQRMDIGIMGMKNSLELNNILLMVEICVIISGTYPG